MTCKHKFSPRYSQKYPKWFTTLVDAVVLGGGKWNADYPRREEIYECDVCVKCGVTTA